jgi:phosphomannomutase
MITASHNPAGDNGYKVFLGDGAQIAPPADDEISLAIDRVGPLIAVSLGEGGERVGEEIVDDYLDAVISALPLVDAREITTVYTPLHGVGRGVLLAAFDRVGFPAPHVVAAQGDPDPDFPTVPKPNPEEPGVLDLALADARSVGADLVIANDPDADRLAVAIPSDAEPSGWRILRGDELGVLLGEFLLTHRSDPGHALVASTIVSSSLLGHLAHAVGATYVETLTGFKWIMHDSAARPDRQFIFGYEQALGYSVNDVVRDKDGISAALLIAEIAAEAKRDGRSTLTASTISPAGSGSTRPMSSHWSCPGRPARSGRCGSWTRCAARRQRHCSAWPSPRSTTRAPASVEPPTVTRRRFTFPPPTCSSGEPDSGSESLSDRAAPSRS